MTGGMTREERERALIKLGAKREDINALLAYTENVFKPVMDITPDDAVSHKWPLIWGKVKTVCASPPHMEIFQSPAGAIPIIYVENTADFERLVLEIVYEGKGHPHIGDMGASFVYGKTLRFIILSNKPYSGVASEYMGLPYEDWLEKSAIIRKYHECAHYYTKKYFGSSRNNLHDELIADFCGLYGAFGEYRAEWFIRFFETRYKIYTSDLSEAVAGVIKLLAAVAANAVEAWAMTEEFKKLGNKEQIDYLAGKELLLYV